MLYTLITFALVFFTCLLFLPKFKRFIEQQSVAFNFLLTMVATLVGVLLAIAISNYEADKKEQEDVVRLIDASITSIESCAGYTQALLEHAENQSLDAQASEQFFLLNPAPYPEYVDVFLAQPVVSKNLSSDGLSDLNGIVINLKRTITSKPKVYLELLTQTREVLLVERRYQGGEIDEVELDRLLDQIQERPLSL